MSKEKRTLARWMATVAALGVAAALAVPVIYAQEKPEGAGEVTRAVAVLHPASDSEVRGVVTFTKVEGGVRVVAHIEGLKPGLHGFHVHEFGDCTAPDAGSAGGHFNPTNKPHAGPDDAERHEGDLGNVEADANGVAHYDRVDKEVELNGAHSIVGRAVIVHADPDDLKSQPTGNAGARLACGVVGIAKPE